jgi:hypothetical protein
LSLISKIGIDANSKTLYPARTYWGSSDKFTALGRLADSGCTLQLSIPFHPSEARVRQVHAWHQFPTADLRTFTAQPFNTES